MNVARINGTLHETIQPMGRDFVKIDNIEPETWQHILNDAFDPVFRERYEWPTAFVIDGIGFWRSVSISALPASA